jgi:phage repressor protein C with HTH and peptisase S24 domain
MCVWLTLLHMIMGTEASVADRLNELTRFYGLNANSLTHKLNYPNNSKMYKLLGGTEPSFPTLVDILRAFPDVSPDWLVLGNGQMLRGESGGAAAPAPSTARAVATERLPAINSGRVLTITVDRDGEDNTELVPVAAQAGYTLQHNEGVVKELPRYRVPGFENGKFRAFEVSGDSMEPTLNHRDIVVCSYVDNWRLLVPGDVYVVVTDESVMLKRIRQRITDRASEVMLYSDNPHRPPYPMECSEITELWRVRGYVSSYLPSTPDVTAERLWEVIDALGLDRGAVRAHLEENAPTDAPR